VKNMWCSFLANPVVHTELSTGMWNSKRKTKTENRLWTYKNWSSGFRQRRHPV